MVDAKINGDTLTITIDISEAAFKTAKPSASGKTRLVATTHGAVPIVTAYGVVNLSLNLTTK